MRRISNLKRQTPKLTAWRGKSVWWLSLTALTKVRTQLVVTSGVRYQQHLTPVSTIASGKKNWNGIFNVKQPCTERGSEGRESTFSNRRAIVFPQSRNSNLDPRNNTSHHRWSPFATQPFPPSLPFHPFHSHKQTHSILHTLHTFISAWKTSSWRCPLLVSIDAGRSTSGTTRTLIYVDMRKCVHSLSWMRARIILHNDELTRDTK